MVYVMEYDLRLFGKSARTSFGLDHFADCIPALCSLTIHHTGNLIHRRKFLINHA